MVEILEEIEKKTSYSAASMFLKCKRKAYYKYGLRLAKDPDVEDDALALRFGSTFHLVCEWTQHERDLYRQDHLVNAGLETKLEPDEIFKVYACLMSYYKLHRASQLKCVGIELEVASEDIIGYVDAVMADKNGNWWIVDLKTSGMIMEQLFARLHRDPQLNLYACFAGQIAQKLKLDTAKFAGVRYRVVAKPRSTPKPGETYDAYHMRAAPEVYDVEVPADVLDYQEALENIMSIRTDMKALNSQNATCNRQACLEYNRPCEYWSQCHGKTFTECKDSVKVFTLKNINDRTKA